MNETEERKKELLLIFGLGPLETPEERKARLLAELEEAERKQKELKREILIHNIILILFILLLVEGIMYFGLLIILFVKNL